MFKRTPFLFAAPMLLLAFALFTSPAPTRAIVVHSNASAVCTGASGRSCTGPAVGGDVWWSSGFSVPAGLDYALNSVTLYLSGDLTPIEAAVYTDNGGVPGSLIASLGSQAPNTGGVINPPAAVGYGGGVLLQAGANYHIVAKGVSLGAADALWPDSAPPTAPTGIFGFTSVNVSPDFGASWTVMGSVPALEIDATETISSTPTFQATNAPAWSPGDDRIAPYIGADLNAYCRAYGLAIYTANGGELIVTNEQIDAVGLPDVNTLISSGAGISLYRLSDGLFQIMMAPSNGKQEFIIFEKPGCAVGRWRRGHFYLSSVHSIIYSQSNGWENYPNAY